MYRQFFSVLKMPHFLVKFLSKQFFSSAQLSLLMRLCGLYIGFFISLIDTCII